MPGNELGQASEYAVIFRDRSSRQALWSPEARAVTKLTWERRVNEVADHVIEVTKSALPAGQVAMLGSIDPWAHEASIYRITGTGAALVAIGPVYDYTETASTVTLTCHDVTAWLDKRLTHTAHTWPAAAPEDVAVIAGTIIRDALGPDTVDLLTALTVQPAGIRIARTTPAFTLAGDELRALAALGMDYTTIGRGLLVTGEIGKTYPPAVVLTDDHFTGDLSIQLAGAETVTRQVVIGGGAIPPIAYAGGIDDRIGLLEAVQTVTAATTPVAARTAAQVALAATYPTPLYLQIPDDAQLHPRAPVRLEQLVCGTGIRVSLSRFARPVTELLRLVRVTGAWDPTAGEQIGITLAPWAATTQDAADYTGDPTADTIPDTVDSSYTPGTETYDPTSPDTTTDPTSTDPSDTTVDPSTDPNSVTPRQVCWDTALPREPYIDRMRRWMTVTGDIPT